MPTNYGTGKGTVKAPLYQEASRSAPPACLAAASQQLSFTSGNLKVATVDENGKVMFLTAGAAKITVAAMDGSNVKTVISITVTK